MFYLLNAPFVLDFVATSSLFVLCFLLVLGVKAVKVYLNALLPEKKLSAPEPTKSCSATKKTVKRRTVKPIRSIEINPEEIDRIYVKKIS